MQLIKKRYADISFLLEQYTCKIRYSFNGHGFAHYRPSLLISCICTFVNISVFCISCTIEMV